MNRSPSRAPIPPSDPKVQFSTRLRVSLIARLDERTKRSGQTKEDAVAESIERFLDTTQAVATAGKKEL